MSAKELIEIIREHVPGPLVARRWQSKHDSAWWVAIEGEKENKYGRMVFYSRPHRCAGQTEANQLFAELQEAK